MNKRMDYFNLGSRIVIKSIFFLPKDLDTISRYDICMCIYETPCVIDHNQRGNLYFSILFVDIFIFNLFYKFNSNIILFSYTFLWGKYISWEQTMLLNTL